MTYHHLSREERYQISALLKEGLTQSQIAANLSRHKATIGREIARNSGLRGYRPRQASFLASGRSINSRNARRIERTHPAWTAVKRPFSECLRISSSRVEGRQVHAEALKRYA